jgi:hypothetical protein
VKQVQYLLLCLALLQMALMAGCQEEQFLSLNNPELTVPDTVSVDTTQKRQIKIEDAPDGAGKEIGEVSLQDGASLILYAVIRDQANRYLGNAEVRWSLSNALGSLSVSDGMSSVFQPDSLDGETVIRAAWPGLGSAETSPITILFTPNQIKGLIAWYKADSGVITDGASGAVRSWEDRSNTRVAVHQEQDSARPLLIENALNGKPVLRFDGRDDFLSPVAMSLFQDNSKSGLSVFAVYRTDLPTEPDPEGDYIPATRPSNATLKTEYTISAIRNSSRISRIFVNGESWQSDKILSKRQPIATLRAIGKSVAGAGAFSGDIAEILVYETALTDVVVQAVVGYLNKKYAIY